MTPPASLVCQRTWHVDQMPVLTMTLSLPWREGHRRFNRFYRTQQTAYLSYCQGVLLPLAQQDLAHSQETGALFTPHSATMDHEITYDQGEIVSLYTRSQDHSGLLCHGDTWDMGRGFPLPIRTFFPERKGYKRLLASRAWTEIQALEAQGDAKFHPQLKVSTLMRRFNPRNYYLTPEGVAFFYPQFSIAPGVEGVPTFFYPWDETVSPHSRK